MMHVVGICQSSSVDDMRLLYFLTEALLQIPIIMGGFAVDYTECCFTYLFCEFFSDILGYYLCSRCRVDKGILHDVAQWLLLSYRTLKPVLFKRLERPFSSVVWSNYLQVFIYLSTGSVCCYNRVVEVVACACCWETLLEIGPGLTAFSFMKVRSPKHDTSYIWLILYSAVLPARRTEKARDQELLDGTGISGIGYRVGML